jgi:hypothetical protein
MSIQLDSNKNKIDQSSLKLSGNYEQDDGVITGQQIKSIESMVSQYFEFVESVF